MRLVLLLAAAVASFGVSQTPNLSGRWTIDAARSASTGGGRGARRGGNGGNGMGGGLGLGPSPDSLTIQQDALSLTVQEYRGTRVTRTTYALDGVATRTVLGSGEGVRPGTFTSAWRGDQLVTTISAPASPVSKDTVKYEERRYLDRNGALVVSTSMAGKPNSRTAIYVRAK